MDSRLEDFRKKAFGLGMGVKCLSNRVHRKGLTNDSKWCILSSMRPKLDVVRTNIYLTKIQAKRFKALSKKKGVSVAELIRRVLDQWLEKQ